MIEFKIPKGNLETIATRFFINILILWFLISTTSIHVTYLQDTVSSTKVLTDLGGTYDWAYSTAIQPDGKILAGGFTNKGPTYDFALVRYNPNLTLDQSFGFDGITFTDFNNSDDRSYALTLQPDGKVLLAGTSNGHLAISRYLPNGQLDQSFGNEGKVLNDKRPLTTDIIHSILVQEDGKILISGVTYDSTFTLNPDADFILSRYLPNGQLDLTFGTAGITTTDFSTGSYDESYAMLVQKDGNIILGGYTTNKPNPGTLYGADQLAFAGYTPQGQLNPYFANKGILIIDGGTLDESILTMYLDTNQDIIAGGYVNGEDHGNLLLVKLSSNGFPTTVTINDLHTNSEKITSILVTNNRIIAGGQIAPNNNSDFAIFTYSLDGKLEHVTSTDYQGREDRIHAIDKNSTGNIIAVGQSETDFAVWELEE